MVINTTVHTKKKRKKDTSVCICAKACMQSLLWATYIAFSVLPDTDGPQYVSNS